VAWPFNKTEEQGGTKTANEPEVKDAPKESQEELIKRLFAESFTPINEKFSALESEIKSIKEKPPAPPAAPDAIPSVLDDEAAAFAARIGPVAYQNYLTQAKLTLMEVKDEYPREMWQRFQKEITEALAKENVVFQANAQGVRNVVDMIIGRAARENGFRYDAKRKFFLEDASQTADPSNPQAEADREFLDYSVTLPPNRDGKSKVVSRKSFLEGMGVSPEDAKKAMSKLQVVS